MQNYNLKATSGKRAETALDDVLAVMGDRLYDITPFAARVEELTPAIYGKSVDDVGMPVVQTPGTYSAKSWETEIVIYDDLPSPEWPEGVRAKVMEKSSYAFAPDEPRPERAEILPVADDLEPVQVEAATSMYETLTRIPKRFRDQLIADMTAVLQAEDP